MKNVTFLLLAAIVIILRTGCTPSATGPPFTEPVGPDPGKVVVYLYLADSSNIAWPIFVDDTYLTRLVTRSYYRYVGEAGPIMFSIQKSMMGPEVNFGGLAGTTHFVKLGIDEAPHQVRRTINPVLIHIDEATALHELQGLRLVVPSKEEKRDSLLRYPNGKAL